jgi:hypothetical protein
MGSLDKGADADNQPLWVIEIPFKDPSFGPPLTISSSETPASLRALREFQAAVAKATPIVYAPDADYQECLAIVLEMEKEAAMEKAIEKTIGNAMASLSIGDSNPPPPPVKKKGKRDAPPPPPPSEPISESPGTKKKRKIVAPPPPPPSE